MTDAERVVFEAMQKRNLQDLAEMTAQQVGAALGVCAWLSCKMGLTRRVWMRTCRRLWKEASRA